MNVDPVRQPLMRETVAGAPIAPPTITPARETEGVAVAALVLGIIGMFLFVLPVMGAILAILALVFGIMGARKGRLGRGMAIAGLVMGAVSLCLTVGFWSLVYLEG